MTITIVNMIPASSSGETNNDTEPSIAVNPANPQQVAGTTFTPDPTGGTQGPVFRSVNGGTTWDLPDFFPTQTIDQTLRFAGISNILYASYIDPSDNMHIVRIPDLAVNGLAANLKTVAGTAGGNVFDQPYIESYTDMGGGGANTDRIYVGGNDWTLNSANPPAVIVQSLDAGIAAPVFTENTLESRAIHRNGPQVRTAAHADGTVYAVFYSFTAGGLLSDTNWTAITANVTIVRDDNWGNNGAPPYADLLDTDSKAGKRIATGIQFTWDYILGEERTAGDLSIAVDPTNSKNVYVAWAELLSGVYTLHLMNSATGGATWSADLFAGAITNATHPCLAINSQGKIGFLYQQITGVGSTQTWETHFRSSPDGIAWDDTILCTAINSPTVNTIFSLGDYTHMMAVGKNFYGVFPADNTPNLANFPSTATVIYNRNHNFATQQLFANNGVSVVSDSVDPFFFVVQELSPDQDFYVRDWTTNAATHDQGQEPSTNPVFYETSDIWNSITNAPGTPVNDWYQGDPANKGAGTLGDNYAFARISRNTSGSTNTVNAQFFYADYGLGIPYASIGTQSVPFLTTDLENLTAGQLWDLPATASNHVCLGIQISTTNDPFIPPGLNGNVPGWPYPDLMVINDNNKAQRNLTTVLVTAGMTNQSFMRIRNAATQTRDLTVGWNVVMKRGTFGKATIGIVGDESKAFKASDSLVLKNMKPGENRWLSFSFDSFDAADKAGVSVDFRELNGKQAVNGCSFLIQPAPLNKVLHSILQFQQSILYRLTKGFGHKIDNKLHDLTKKLLKERSPQAAYWKHIGAFAEGLGDIVSSAFRRHPGERQFNFAAELRVLGGATRGNAAAVMAAHSILLNKMDLALTMTLVADGDLACILANVRLQADLYTRVAELSALKATPAMLKKASDFITGYSAGKLKNKHYPDFIKDSLRCFRETVNNHHQPALKKALDEVENKLTSLQALQKAHYQYLLLLNK